MGGLSPVCNVASSGEEQAMSEPLDLSRVDEILDKYHGEQGR